MIWIRDIPTVFWISLLSHTVWCCKQSSWTPRGHGLASASHGFRVFPIRKLQPQHSTVSHCKSCQSISGCWFPQSWFAIYVKCPQLNSYCTCLGPWWEAFILTLLSARTGISAQFGLKLLSLYWNQEEQHEPNNVPFRKLTLLTDTKTKSATACNRTSRCT